MQCATLMALIRLAHSNLQKYNSYCSLPTTCRHLVKPLSFPTVQAGHSSSSGRVAESCPNSNSFPRQQMDRIGPVAVIKYATLPAYLPSGHCAERSRLMWMFLRSVGEETFVMLSMATQNTSACPCPVPSSTPSVSQLGRREPREPFQMMFLIPQLPSCSSALSTVGAIRFSASQFTATTPLTTTTTTIHYHHHHHHSPTTTVPPPPVRWSDQSAFRKGYTSKVPSRVETVQNIWSVSAPELPDMAGTLGACAACSNTPRWAQLAPKQRLT